MKTLLAKISKLAISIPDLNLTFTEEHKTLCWLGNAPATKQDIEAAEIR